MMKPPLDLAGVVRLRRDLIAEGMTDDQIARLVRARALTRVRYGAYVPTPVWVQASEEERHRLLCRAVVARADPMTALTHVSSVVERCVPVWGFDLGVVHTTRLGADRAGRKLAGWTPHRGVLGDDDVEELHGVVVSTAPRSAFEVTTVTGVEPALVVVNRLLHARAMTLQDLEHQVEAHADWPGSLTATIVLRLADARLESVGEDRFSYVTYTQGLPRPEPQWTVCDESGTVVARLDFAWPDHGVFVEFDGRVKYERHRRDGETLEEFLMREKRREELVCQLTGWTCVRVTWADLARPERLAARIRAVFESRRREGRRLGA